MTYMAETNEEDKPLIDLIEGNRDLPDIEIDPEDSDLVTAARNRRPAWERIAGNLSRDAEIALFARMRAGDQTARDTLIVEHWPLCVKVANTYRGGLDRDSAVSAAMMGLVSIIDRPDFDPNLYSIGTFAWKWMQAEVERAKLDSGSGTRPKRSKIRAEKAPLYRSNPGFFNPPEWAYSGRVLDDSIGTEIRASMPHAEMLLDSSHADTEGDAHNLHETIASDALDPDESLSISDRARLTARFRAGLNDRHRRIFDERIQDNTSTLNALGYELGLSREGVRKIEVALHAKLCAVHDRHDVPELHRVIQRGYVPGGYVTQSGYFRSDTIALQRWIDSKRPLPADAFVDPRRLSRSISPAQAAFRGIEKRVINVLFRQRSNRSYRERCQDIYVELIASYGDTPLRALQRLRWVILKWCRNRSADVRREPTWVPLRPLTESDLKHRHHNAVSWWGTCKEAVPRSAA